MKLSGRITFFGEYLLKDNLSYCLCVMSKLFLSNELEHKHIIHPNYASDKDKTIPLLARYGITQFSTIYGNLPLGYGLSSSTILSLLHLKSPSRQDVIASVDKVLNGFSPSELDYTSITRQENGFFGFGEWVPLKNYFPFYSLIIIPKEGKRKLADVKVHMQISQHQQILLTKELYHKLIQTGELDLSLLYEYCKLLLSIGIYSKTAGDIANNLIAKGICCKCVGGLYDKALLTIHPDKGAKILSDKYLLETYPFVNVLE